MYELRQKDKTSQPKSAKIDLELPAIKVLGTLCVSDFANLATY